MPASSPSSSAHERSRSWITPTVVGIVLATFLSDFSHEMCTAVLPLYLATLGLGPAALGLIEGIADFLVSLSKLLGGVVGHHVRHKRPWASLGYLVTAVATWGIGLVNGLAALLTLRGAAWIGRGFRGPLRDYLLADAVAPTHYGRAYGLERAGDMLGAVAGPLAATLFVWAGMEFRTVILWTLVPGLLAAGSMFFLTREHRPEPSYSHQPDRSATQVRPPFPRAFWFFLIGVLLFGLGDFSRTFLIWLAAEGLGENGAPAAGAVSGAVLLYTLHNLVSAAVAYPIGRLGDRLSKFRVLLWGYGVGVGTNVLLALFSDSLGWLVAVVILSGISIAVEETLEKAVAADILPRELRSLGFGVLACANAVGDMVSSLYVGFLLEAQHSGWAFGLAAAAGTAGVAWLMSIPARFRSRV
ncbi:MAG: MFS transporter [Nitrospirota bacterium]